MAVQLPPRPVVPVPPPTVAAEMQADRILWSQLDSGIRAGLSGGGDHVALEDLADQLRGHLLHRPVRSEQERTERDQGELAVRKYNDEARRYNEALRALKQERRNQAEVRTVRAAACARCFATHAGEC